MPLTGQLDIFTALLLHQLLSVEPTSLGQVDPQANLDLQIQILTGTDQVVPCKPSWPGRACWERTCSPQEPGRHTSRPRGS